MKGSADVVHTNSRRLFAIRQKSTGLFLPQVKHNFTWQVPCKVTKRPLRLYHSKRAANVSLTHWLRGVYQYDGCLIGMPVMKPRHCGLPDRTRSDMEVVELRLEVIPNG